MGFDDREVGDGSWWLVKVPQRLGEAWSKTEAGAVLGEIEDNVVRVARGAQSTNTYDIVRQPGAVGLRPFRRVGAAQAELVGGQPVATLTLKPREGIGYRRDLRTRMFESMQSTRVVQMLDEEPKHVARAPIQLKRRRDDDTLPPGKQQKTQMDRGELKSRLLRIFADPKNSEAMTVKDVNAALGEVRSLFCVSHVSLQASMQPEGYLRDVLNDICIKHKADNGRTSYDLKPEFRDNRDQKS